MHLFPQNFDLLLFYFIFQILFIYLFNLFLLYLFNYFLIFISFYYFYWTLELSLWEFYLGPRTYEGINYFLTLKTLYIMTFTIFHIKGENPFDIDHNGPPSYATQI